MKTDTIQIRGARAKELRSVHAVLGRAFEKVPESFFNRRVQTAPSFKPEHTRILLLNGRIVSCARVYFREIRVAGKAILCGGLGDVGTDPEYRGRGYSSQCIQDALEYVKKKGAPISMLFTHIQPFYGKLGFFPIRTLDLTIRVPNFEMDIYCKSISVNKDLASIQKMHAGFVRSRTGPVHRTAAYWRKQGLFPNVDQSFFWKAVQNKRILSYTRGVPAEKHLRIQEFAYAPEKEHALFSLLSVMAGLTHRNKIYMQFVSESEKNLFNDWILTVEDNTRWMVRLIDLNRKDLLKELLKSGQNLFWDSDRF